MLSNKIEIIIPKGKLQSGMVKFNTMKTLTLLCGGTSYNDIEGVWIDDNGNFHTDYSWHVTSYSEHVIDRGIIVDMARGIAKTLDQLCVMIVINGNAEFIMVD